MAKGKSTWKYNKLLTARRNYFDLGGQGNSIQLPNVNTRYYPNGIVKLTPQQYSIPTTTYTPPATINSPELSTKSSSSIGLSDGIGKGLQVASAASGILGTVMSNIGSGDINSRKKSALANVNNSQLGTQGTDYSIDQLISDWNSVPTLQSVTAKDFRNNSGDVGSAISSGIQGSTAGLSVGGPWGAVIGGIAGTGASIIGSLFGRNKAKKAAREVNEAIEYTNAFNERSLINRVNNVMNTQYDTLAANYSALGGPLIGPTDYEFANRYLTAKELSAVNKITSLPFIPSTFASGGSIHIKPENKGKFTETKRRTGKTTEELTHSSNPLTRKRAIFAQNAKKWHHAFGGELNTQGADFTNGIVFIDNGGSHESNPLEGVPIGVDPEGAPNLVEEGETIFNDYVFSRRLKVPKAVKEKYKLRGTKSISFADASKQLAKESEERPNDPISQNGLEALMSDLANAQEELKAKKQSNQFANGGKVNKFDGTTTSTQQMYAFDPFLEALRGYTSSKIAGNVAGKYRPDPYIPMEGNPYMLGATDIAALENNDDYKAFTEAMIANPNMDYIRALDAGIASGVPRLIGDNGELVSNWADLYRARRYDQKGGIYHWTPLIEQTQPQVEEIPREVSSDTPIEVKEKLDRYYYNTGTADSPNYVLLEGQDNAPLWMRNNKYRAVGNNPNDLNGTDYYYSKNDGLDLGRNKLEPLRYAPALGYGISALSDAIGLTNRPDYSNADAILDAVSSAGVYSPIKARTIGNYLKYTPFDEERVINTANANAAATRRAVLQSAGPNIGAGIAGILAADYAAQNNLGDLRVKAEQSNLAQKQAVEEFNRGTNQFNAQAIMQADMANQKALASIREMGLKGIMSAASMKEAAKQASDAAKSANLSGLFQTLSDIGFEAKNDNMVRRALELGMYGPGAEGLYRDKKRKNGGKIKRGLTY